MRWRLDRYRSGLRHIWGIEVKKTPSHQKMPKDSNLYSNSIRRMDYSGTGVFHPTVE
jgi:hypothetical protein